MSGARRAGERGFTMLEVAIATAVLSTVFMIVFRTIGAAQDLNGATLVRADLEVRARIALERMVSELRDSGVSQLSPQPTPPLGASALTFRRATGWSGSTIIWEPSPRRIEWRSSPGEIADDGKDNNGNGLIDEGQVIFTSSYGTAQAVETVLADRVSRLALGEVADGVDNNGDGLVDERGLSFSLTGKLLTIQLSLENLDQKGNLVKVQLTTMVLLRNP